MLRLLILLKHTLLLIICLFLMLTPFFTNPSSVQTSNQNEPRYGGTLRVGHTHWYWEVQVYKRLTILDDEYTVIGDLAKDYPDISSSEEFPTIYNSLKNVSFLFKMVPFITKNSKSEL